MLTTLRVLPIGWWLVASLLLNVIATNLSWRICNRAVGGGQRAAALGKQASSMITLPAIAGFMYNIGLPYAALLAGVLTPETLGLTETHWLTSTGIATAMTAATGVMLWLYRRDLRRGLLENGGSALPAAHASPLPLVTAWRVAFRQAHWAFYRAAAIVLLGSYTGVFGGCGLVLGEWTLNPAWRAGWSDERQRWSLTFDLALVFASAILFVYTRNAWLCVTMHTILALIFAQGDR